MLSLSDAVYNMFAHTLLFIYCCKILLNHVENLLYHDNSIIASNCIKQVTKNTAANVRTYFISRLTDDIKLPSCLADWACVDHFLINVPEGLA